MTVTVDGITHEVVDRIEYWIVRCWHGLEPKQDPDRTEGEVNCMACVAKRVEDEMIDTKQIPWQ
jgi:hypothetical protein